MRVLITNNRLDLRGGAEMFVRDLARGLQARGHSVLAYSSDLGQVERLLESDPVAVTTDLEHLAFRPDIIHAQHHLDAMTALGALPGVPALYHCHGAVWRECAPKHPRIYHYLAVSRTLAERMMVEANIAEADITVWLNCADLARFRTVRNPPHKPARALFFNGHHCPDSETVGAIRSAAARRGLELDFAGFHFGQRLEQPETTLPNYDIVFASGKSAIDALACGCAVIVLGRTSCGEMVCSENYDRFREVNFSIAVNSSPPSVEEIEAQINRFSAADCALVTERLRREADLGPAIEKLVGIYERVIELNRVSPPDLGAESLATSRYLRKIVPLIKIVDEAHKLGQPSTLQNRASLESND